MSDPAPLSPEAERGWTVAVHAIGVLGVLAPLVAYFALHRRGEAIARESREALNFQLTVFLAAIAAAVVDGLFALAALPGFPALVELPIGLRSAVALFGFVFAIIAAVQTSRHGGYRYPLTLRLIR